MNRFFRYALACCMVWLALWCKPGLVLAPLAMAQSQPVAATQATAKNILVLLSYGYGSKGVEIFNDGLRTTLTESGFSVSQLYFEYLDLERNKTDPHYRARLLELLEKKYAARQIDLIITIQQPALHFLLHDGKPIAPLAQVITIQAPLPSEDEAGTRRIISPLTKFDIQGTLERALAMLPDTKRVVFVSGSSEADRKMALDAGAIAARWQDRLAFEYTADLSLDAMLRRVASLPPHSVIVFTQYNRDAQGRVTVAYEVERMVVKAANAPVFGLYDFNLVNGGVGGSVVSVKGLGERTAKIAMDLLDGQLQLTQPVTRATHEVIAMFDWTQIKRWGGDPQALGPDTVFIHRVPTFMEQYRLQVLGVLLFVAAQSLLILGLLRSRNQKARAEQSLRESEQNLAITLDCIGDAVIATDAAGRVTRMNPTAERLTGWPLTEAHGMALREVFNIVNASSRQCVPDPVQLVMETGKVVGLANHTVLLARDQQEYQIADSAAPIRNPSGTIVGVVLVFSDVTEKYRIEQALRTSYQSLERILKTSTDGFWRLDAKGRLLEVNDAYCRQSGYRQEELRTMHVTDLDAAESQAETALHLQRVQATGNDLFETLHRRKDGTLWQVEISATHDGGSPGQFFAFLRDITQRKQVEASLRTALKEQVALLHEVHHRVKNNLQVITSLLRLEAGRSAQPGTKEVLADMQGRIRSMALLHESLYRTGIFASVELGTYVKQLATQALRAQSGQSGTIRLQLDLEAVQVGMDQATPCGLLINELISNSLKHGFPQGRTGEIRIGLHTLPANDGSTQQVRLWVSDNGVGLPDDFEVRRSQCLGLQLVSDLARQLAATLDRGTGPGTAWTITFSIREHA